tara:strand:+ start:1859 stop:2071 length:213 start_codon:yes stop_codon:yes gene_type:complete
MLVNFVNFLLQKIAAINIIKIFLIKISYLVAVSKRQLTSVFTNTAIREKNIYYLFVGHIGIIINNIGGLK